MKHLLKKDEQYPEPDSEILDTFPNPGILLVTLNQKEFTSLCPITNQPDYASIDVTYKPKYLCLESKSLKLYLSAFRGYPGFAEQITIKIKNDLISVLKCPVEVITTFNRRGGINITSRAVGGEDA